MGSGTSSGRTTHQAQGKALTSAEITKLSKLIDKQAFDHPSPTQWQLIPNDAKINTMWADIIKGDDNQYNLTTYGTSNIQGSQNPLVSTHRTLNAAKTAAREELKGYLPGVRHFR